MAGRAGTEIMSVHRVADALVAQLELAAEALHDADDRDAHPTRDDRILDRCRAGVVVEKQLERTRHGITFGGPLATLRTLSGEDLS